MFAYQGVYTLQSEDLLIESRALALFISQSSWWFRCLYFIYDRL